MKQLIGVITGALLVGSAWAQSAPPPLNLNVPVANAATFNNPSAAGATAAKSAASAPGMFYGDTSGTAVASNAGPNAKPACDDPNYNKAQVHGSVSTTVVGGNHISGTYNTGTVNLTQHYGSCDDSSGGVTISIGASVGQGSIHARRGHW